MNKQTSLLKVFSAATSAEDLLANCTKAQLPFDAIVIDRISPNCKMKNPSLDKNHRSQSLVSH